MVPCVARGSHLFGVPNHDSDSLRWFLQDATGDLPITGFFGDGEVGTIGSKSVVHAYTAAAAIFRDDSHGTEGVHQTRRDRRQFAGSLDEDVQRAMRRSLDEWASRFAAMRPSLSGVQDLDTSISQGAAHEAIPLFLLRQQLFPGCETEFHVFEPRYRIMAARCHAEGSLFGVMSSETHGAAVRIVDYEELEDGRSLIRVKSQSRFSLAKSWVVPATFGLNFGDPEFYCDEDIAVADIQEVSTLAKELQDRFSAIMEGDQHSQLEKAFGSMPNPSDATGISFWISTALLSYTNLPGQVKDNLFTLTDTKKRLGQVNMLLGLIEKEQQSRAAQGDNLDSP